MPRKRDFTVTESLKLGHQLEAFEKPLAQERKAQGQERGRAKQQGKPVASNLDTTKARVDETVAAAVGMGKDTYRKARAVADAAADDPERFGDLPAKMDAVSVDAAHKEAA